MREAAVFSEGIQQAEKIRKQLHEFPELSAQENRTHDYLTHYFRQFRPSQIHQQLGSLGSGLVVEYNSGRPGPTLMLRADTDALPITEAPNPYCQSARPGIMHACGHDGHTAMLAGLAPWLSTLPLTQGRLLLLFQPAEETGQGAQSLLEDSRFSAFQPDAIFGLHNLPGMPLGQLFCKEDTFCFASCGLKVQLKGHSSHAAEKELAHSPAPALSELISHFHAYPSSADCKLTLTHARLGEPSFGICPGEATLQLTLRALSDALLRQQEQYVLDTLQKTADNFQLQLHTEQVEPFPATQNDRKLHALFLQLMTGKKFQTNYLDRPFYWSEDFGFYSKLAPAYFFGLGAGQQLPALHHPAYQFPDQLLPYGLEIWQTLIAHFLLDGSTHAGFS